MKRILTIATMMLTASVLVLAGNDDLKVQKDKATKKFGYINKAKEWVIEPQFDKAKKFDDGYALVEVNEKWGAINTLGEFTVQPIYDDIDGFNKNGLSEVWNKIDKVKYHGVINTEGAEIIPLECVNIHMTNKSRIIYADRYVDLVEPNVYTQSRVHMWGMYNLEGATVAEPQFAERPSFSNGRAIVTDRETGLMGVINESGSYVIEPYHLKIRQTTDGYNTLDVCLTQETFNDAGSPVGSFVALPGAVAPYYTGNDDLLAVAYGHRLIGMRMHRNTIRSCTSSGSSSLTKVSCAPLVDLVRNCYVDWGLNSCRFVRLELVKTGEQHTGDIIYTDGSHYTIQAVLYEANGECVNIISDWGYFTVFSNDALIYRAHGNGKESEYVLFYDINADITENSIALRNCTYPSSNFISLLEFNNADYEMLTNWYKAKDRQRKVYEMENVGVLSYSQLPALSPKERDMVNDLSRHARIFGRKFYIGDVLNCSKATCNEEGNVKIKIEKNPLHIKFVDKFDNVGYGTEIDEDIYFGGKNDRYIGLDLIPVKIDRSKIVNPAQIGYLWDDIHDYNYKFYIQVNLYENDNTYVRTIAECNTISYIGENYLVLNECGLVIARTQFRPQDFPNLEFKNLLSSNYLSKLAELNW